MPKSFVEILNQKVVVFDGAMGTHLQGQNLTAEDFGGEHLNHRDYLEAGADVIETDSFGGTSIVLGEYGIAAMAYDLNFRAARIARGVADGFSRARKAA